MLFVYKLPTASTLCSVQPACYGIESIWDSQLSQSSYPTLCSPPKILSEVIRDVSLE